MTTNVQIDRHLNYLINMQIYEQRIMRQLENNNAKLMFAVFFLSILCIVLTAFVLVPDKSELAKTTASPIDDLGAPGPWGPLD